MDNISDTYFIKALMATIFWVGGFAAAPMIFMATMGIFRNLAGMSTSLSKSFRGKMMSRGREARERGFKAWKADKMAAKELKAQRRGAIAGAGSILTRRGRASRTAMRQQIAQNFSGKATEDASYEPWKGNDTLNRIVAETAADAKEHGWNNSQFLRALETNLRDSNQGFTGDVDQAMANIRTMHKKYGTDALGQAAYISAHAGGTQWTGEKKSGGSRKDGWKLAARLANGDDRVESSLIAKGRSAAMGAGRADMGAGGFSKTARLAGGALAQQFGGEIGLEDYYDDIIEQQGPGVLAHSSMKEDSVKALAPQISRRLQEAFDSGDERRISQELASVAGLLDTMSQTSPANAKVLADIVMNQSMTNVGKQQITPTTVRDAIEDLRGDAAFGQMRREYESRYAQQAAAATAAAAAGPAPGAPGGAPGGPAPGAPGGPQPSDRRLKRNIAHLATVHGIKLHRFQYLWSDQIYVGVMAQDLTSSHPNALSKDEFGYYRVDYSALGLEMLTLQEWEAQQKITTHLTSVL